MKQFPNNKNPFTGITVKGFSYFIHRYACAHGYFSWHYHRPDKEITAPRPYERLNYALTNDSNDQILAFYVNKNKATAVLRKAGYTITGWPNNSNGFIHSITDPKSPVKLRIISQTETRQFKKWFKGSKVTNSDGSPEEMYHGTSSGGFTVFNTYSGKFGLFGKGSYFTDNPEVADSYTRKGKGQNPEVYGVYLSIKNPMDMDAKADLDAWKKAFEKADLDPS